MRAFSIGHDMAKLSLNAAPTFKAMVAIPVAGGDSVEVLMTFKHRTKDDLEAFTNSLAGKPDHETFMEMVEGWELDDPFNADSVKTLLQNYIGSGLAAYKKYVDELYKHKTGN